MAKTTTIDEVAEAVEAVNLLQQQVSGLVDALDRLTKRVVAVEGRLDELEKPAPGEAAQDRTGRRSGRGPDRAA